MTASNSNNQAPKVSVVIASYNHEQYLAETLDSVLSQTFKDFEVVIVDDGSSDNSLQLLRDYEEKYPHIKVLTHSNRENKGISATANLAIASSSGEYISFIGSDDIWYPYTMALQVEAISQDISIGLVYGTAHYISKSGKLLNGILGKDVTQHSSPLESIIALNQIPALTVMVRRRAIEKVGLFDESLVYSDWDLSIRILEQFKPFFINEPLGKYRLHDRNTSVGYGIDPIKIRNDSFAVLKAAEKRLGKIQAIRRGFSNVEKRIANIYIDEYFRKIHGPRHTRDFQLLKKAWSTAPSTIIKPRRLAAILKSFLISKGLSS